MTAIVAWTVFFMCAGLAFYLLATDDPNAYDRARDDAREYDDESDWERDYHARWTPREHDDGAESWGARR